MIRINFWVGDGGGEVGLIPLHAWHGTHVFGGPYLSNFVSVQGFLFQSDVFFSFFASRVGFFYIY